MRGPLSHTSTDIACVTSASRPEIVLPLHFLHGNSWADISEAGKAFKLVRHQSKFRTLARYTHQEPTMGATQA